MTEFADLRVVAVDMDGTFLTTSRDYDRPRFARVLEAMDARGVRFLVASGNQYEQLAGFFDDPDALSFVAENGAHVRDRGEPVFVGRLSPDAVAAALDVLTAMMGANVLGSGPHGAFVPRAADDWFYDHMNFYYPRQARTDALDDPALELFTFSVDLPDGLPAGMVNELRRRLDGIADVTSSGHQSVDVMPRGIHKATGLARLGERWGVPASGFAAFGDGGNDVEMLRWSGRGIAVANAPQRVRDAADEVIGDNDSGALFATLEGWLGLA